MEPNCAVFCFFLFNFDHVCVDVWQYVINLYICLCGSVCRTLFVFLEVYRRIRASLKSLPLPPGNDVIYIFCWLLLKGSVFIRIFLYCKSQSMYLYTNSENPKDTIRLLFAAQPGSVLLKSPEGRCAFWSLPPLHPFTEQSLPQVSLRLTFRRTQLQTHLTNIK